MKHLPLFLVLLALAACTTDSYEKGEGEYSRMQADFVELHANADKQIDYADTDDGSRLTLDEPFTAKWVTKGDSIYRGLLYYKKNDKVVEKVQCTALSVARIVRADSVKQGIKTDPLKFESMWLSKNRRYLNLGIYTKTGEGGDAGALQRIGVVSDTLMANADGTKTLWLRLYHDQGGVPEYYSQRTYFSVLLDGQTADSIRFTINTYSGEMVKTLTIR